MSIEAEVRGGVGSTGPAPVTVRPHLLIRIGAPAAYLTVAGLAIADQPAEHLSDGAAAVFFAVLAVVVIGMALKERLEIDGDEVRVVRLFTEDVVRRADVARVARGRHRFIERREGPTASGPSALRMPGLVTTRQVAEALDVPLTRPDGRPLPGPPVSAADALTETGHLRPYYWALGAVLAVLIGLVVSMVLFWPGS